MRASGPVTPVALGPFLASGVYTGPGATHTDAALPLSHAEPAHQDVYFGPKKRPLGEGRLASPGRAGGSVGSWSLGPGRGSDLFYVRMTRATEEAVLPKQRLKRLGKCAASSFPRDSYPILPAPWVRWDWAQQKEGGHQVEKRELCLSPPPRSISLGTPHHPPPGSGASSVPFPSPGRPGDWA